MPTTRRVKVAEGGTGSAKRRKNKPVGREEELVQVAKPGVESPYPHIAQMYLGKHNDIAIELTRALRAPLARRLGVVRKAPRG